MTVKTESTEEKRDTKEEIKAIRKGLNTVYSEIERLKQRYLQSMNAIANDIQTLERRMEQNEHGNKRIY